MIIEPRDNIDNLKAKGIKPSAIRINVLNYLKKHDTHPTVDEIYSNLKLEMPTLSKTSIYNTLDLFVNSGLVLPLFVGDGECRYDYTTIPHGHFLCKRCGKVIDFGLEKIVYSGLEGFQIDHKDVFFFGNCLKCK